MILVYRQIVERWKTLPANRTKSRAAAQKRMKLECKNRTKFVPVEFLTSVGEGRTIAKYRRNQQLFLQGDCADSIYFIVKGRVKVTVVSGIGKEAVVAIIDKGDFCGEGCLSGQIRRLGTARALIDCEITRIEKAVVIRALREKPAFAAFFLGRSLKRTIRLEEDLVDQLFNSSEKRLARALLMLANFGKEGSAPEPVIARISQATLAEMIGTTRSRVSLFMNKFRKQGFISYNGAVKIHHSLLSVVLNERPPHIKADTEALDEI